LLHIDVYIFDIFVLKTKITIKISRKRNFIKNLTHTMTL